jgi:uncharacterized protein YcbK (DUF882 family)
VRVCARQTAGTELSALHAVRRVGSAAFFLVAGSFGLQHANAVGDTRTISLHHVHTDEDLTITYKKNGRYDEDALKKINWIMRDWRKNQDTKIDPEEIDLLWDVYREVGATEPIHIICGYRSPETNSMLRRRSKGVARFSQHTLGKAIDFYIPGVPLDKLRATAMKLQGGGVGYYPTSGSPFMHLDVGNVRAWPRMTREQLVKLFPDGRTVHLPRDGTPLPGYQLALADLERGGERTAAPVKKRSLLAALFGMAQDAEESDDNASARQNVAAPRRQATRQATPAPAAPAVPTRTVVAAATAPAPEAIPLPPTRPIYEIASAESRPVPAPAPRHVATAQLAALTPNEIINLRGYWDSQPETTGLAAPADDAPVHSLSSARRMLASSLSAASGRDLTATAGPFARPDRVPPEIALAYAAQADSANPRPAPAPVVHPVNRTAPTVVTRRGSATVAIKPAETKPSSHLAKTADRLNDPWLRGLTLVASVHDSMIVTRFGDPDYSRLAQYMNKPNSAVMMTFSHDPHLRMTDKAFTGGAVVFQPTVTFADQHTAALP